MYKLDRLNNIVRIADGLTIPRDVNNRYYNDYVDWERLGNQPTPYVPPPPTQDELDLIATKQYAKLQALLKMSPTQIQAWVETNITNLATAKDAITTLAIGFVALGRDRLKGQ